MLKFALPAVALAAAVATPALALEVTKTATIPASPDAVWKAIGPFCQISAWHPAIESCALSEKAGNPVRTLALKGGGTLVEEQTGRDEGKMDYSYVILSGPLPIEDYRSTITVTKDGSGSKVTWSGSFKAKGAPDAKAEEIVGGIYDAGLKGIADKAR